MIFLKRLKAVLFLFLASTSFIFAVDFDFASSAGNFMLSEEGITSKIPDFGFEFILNEDLGKNIKGELGIQREVGIGNNVWGSIAYFTDLMEISIGTSFSVFNTGFQSKHITSLFHPGIKTSLGFNIPIGFFIKLNTNFSIPLGETKKKTVYLQNGMLDIGWRFPNIITSLRLVQKNKAITEKNEVINISITDIGFYSHAYSKPSRFRIPVNILCRINQFEKINTKETSNRIGHIVLETGIEHILAGNMEWFFTFAASVFSFSLSSPGSAVGGFFFNSTLGVKFALYE